LAVALSGKDTSQKLKGKTVGKQISTSQRAGDVLSTTLDRLWLPNWTAGLVELDASASFEMPAGQGAFYAVRTGQWRLVLPELVKAVVLQPGDVALLAHGVTHRLAPTIDRASNLPFELHRRPCACVGDQLNGASAEAAMIYGSFSVERPLCSSFESSLPELLHISSQAPSLPTNFAAIASLVESESRRSGPGAQAIVNRLAQVLLLETLRAFANDQFRAQETAADWLRAALDPEIGGALNLIHSRPEQPWTVQSLAGQIHMSRSAFAERFRQLVGNSPLQYLTKCRMQKAGRMLRETELGVKEIASLAGYESVTSFSSAFKRQTGTSPAAFRKRDAALV